MAKKKKKETKAKFTKKEVKAMVMVAEEMNNIMGLVPEIEVDADEPEALLEGITTNAEDIHPVKDEDDFSKKAWKWLGEKDLIPDEPAEEEEDDAAEVTREGVVALVSEQDYDDLETFLEEQEIEDDVDIDDYFDDDEEWDDDEDEDDLVNEICEALEIEDEPDEPEEPEEEKIAVPEDWDALMEMDGEQLEALEVQEEMDVDSDDFDLDDKKSLKKYRKAMAKELGIKKSKKSKKDKGSKKSKKSKSKKDKGTDDKKKKKKGKAVVTAKGKKTGLGVIAFICQTIKDDGPITKKEILKKMKKEFPDRNEKSMMSTINVQVPGKINREKDFNVEETEDGWEVEEEKKSKKKKKSSSKKKEKKEKKEKPAKKKKSKSKKKDKDEKPAKKDKGKKKKKGKKSKK